MSLSGGLSAGLVAGLSGRAMAGVSAWNPGDLPGTPREWLAGPQWCYTDGSAAIAAASSQSLSVASNSTLQAAGVDFWLAGWVNAATVPSGSPIDVIAGKRSGITEEYALQLVNGGQTSFFAKAGGVGTGLAGDFVTPGTWAFVLGWFNAAAGTLNLRVNGGTVYSVASTGADATAVAFRLGTGLLGGGFNGRLACVAFGKSPPGGIASVISTISSRLYASGSGIVYADTTPAERTAWGLVSWWDLVRSGVFTDSHGTNNLTNNNGVTFGAGLPRSRAGDTDPVSVIIDRFQGTLWTEADPLKRLVLRDLGSGQWVLRSDGINDGIGHGPATTGARTIAMAYTQTVVGSTRVLQTPSGTNSLVSPRRSPDTTIFVSGGNVRIAAFADDSNPHVFCLGRSGAGDWRGWSDGVALTVSPVSNNFGSLGVGAFTGSNTADTFTGDIYSVVDVAADLSDADRAKLTTYLAALYGGTL